MPFTFDKSDKLPSGKELISNHEMNNFVCREIAELVEELATGINHNDDLTQFYKYIDDMISGYKFGMVASYTPLITVFQKLITNNLIGYKLLNMIRIDYNDDSKLFLRNIHYVITNLPKLSQEELEKRAKKSLDNVLDVI